MSFKDRLPISNFLVGVLHEIGVVNCLVIWRQAKRNLKESANGQQNNLAHVN